MQSYHTETAEWGDVLIVDDMRAVAGVIAELLRLMGFAPREAHTGRQAIALFEANPQPFLLAVVDIQLPDLNGLELMRRLRATCPRLPVILISGSPLPGHAGDLNAEFLMKPFRVEDLDVVVRKTVDRQEQMPCERILERKDVTAPI